MDREGNARVLAEALTRLPETVREVTVRSDSAGHSVEVIRFCNRPEFRPGATRRFGVVGFAISAVRSVELMAAVEATLETAWNPLRRLEKRTAEGEGSRRTQPHKRPNRFSQVIRTTLASTRRPGRPKPPKTVAKRTGCSPPG